MSKAAAVNAYGWGTAIMLFGFLFSATKSAPDDPRIADVVIFAVAFALLALPVRFLRTQLYSALGIIVLFQEIVCGFMLIGKVLYSLGIAR
jgi:uncharacterized membrane protein YdcZ (DUF606 family)